LGPPLVKERPLAARVAARVPRVLEKPRPQGRMLAMEIKAQSAARFSAPSPCTSFLFVIARLVRTTHDHGDASRVRRRRCGMTGRARSSWVARTSRAMTKVVD